LDATIAGSLGIGTQLKSAETKLKQLLTQAEGLRRAMNTLQDGFVAADKDVQKKTNELKYVLKNSKPGLFDWMKAMIAEIKERMWATAAAIATLFGGVTTTAVAVVVAVPPSKAAYCPPYTGPQSPDQLPWTTEEEKRRLAEEKKKREEEARKRKEEERKRNPVDRAAAEEIKEYADLADAAYKNWKKGDGFPDRTKGPYIVIEDTISRGGMQVTVFEKDGELYVAFRGSQPLKKPFELPTDYVQDWVLDNLGSAIVGYSVQEAAAKKLASELMDRYSNKKINVTGHSLGGANALAFASKIAEKSPARLGDVYTYNARPNISDTSSLKNCQDHITNVYVEGDYVGDKLHIYQTNDRYGAEIQIDRIAKKTHGLENFTANNIQETGIRRPPQGNFTAGGGGGFGGGGHSGGGF